MQVLDVGKVATLASLSSAVSTHKIVGRDFLRIVDNLQVMLLAQYILLKMLNARVQSVVVAERCSLISQKLLLIYRTYVDTADLLGQYRCVCNRNHRFKITQDGPLLLVKVQAANVASIVVVGLEAHNVRLQLVASSRQPLAAGRVTMRARVGASAWHLNCGGRAASLSAAMPNYPIVALVAWLARIASRQQVLVHLPVRSSLAGLTTCLATQPRALRHAQRVFSRAKWPEEGRLTFDHVAIGIYEPVSLTFSAWYSIEGRRHAKGRSIARLT